MNILMAILYIYVVIHLPCVMRKKISALYFQDIHNIQTTINMCKYALTSIKYIMNKIRKFVARKWLNTIFDQNYKRRPCI